MSRFVDCGRDQAFLLPPDLREWIPEDDLAHFVIEAVERVDMGAFKVNRRGTGSAQYHPRMMLALLIYCYANGIFSSRRIERATRRDIGVRFVAANSHPDHDTIATFRRDNLAAVGESFLQVLLLAKEMKLVKLGVVSVDGSKFAANASKHRSVRYDRAGELIEELRLEVAALMERAEAADDGSGEGPQALPKARAEAERAAYEAKVAARAGRKGRAKGKRPKPPEGTPRGDEQSNLSDPDSRLMRKSKRHEFRQALQCPGGCGRRGLSAGGPCNSAGTLSSCYRHPPRPHPKQLSWLDGLRPGRIGGCGAEPAQHPTAARQGCQPMPELAMR